MRTNHFLPLAPLALTALALTVGACGSEPSEDGNEITSGKQPNIILVVIDTLRQDALGCNGNPRNLTPELDRLASEGVLFTGARSSSPWTLPAHASLFSSMMPSQHGVVTKKKRLSSQYTTLAEVIHKAGWRTGAFTDGAFVHPHYGYMNGFNRIYISPDAARKKGQKAGVRHVTRQALKWIRKSTKPFFAFIHTYEVHAPQNPAEPFRSQFVRPYAGQIPAKPIRGAVMAQFNAGQLDDEDIRYLHDLYSAEVAYTDHVLGEFFEQLRQDGLMDETLIVVTSDHGENFGEHGHLGHGNWLHESLLRIPLIVRYPGVYDGGARVQENVRLIDIAPSILEVVDVPIPAGWEGQSLRDLTAPRDFLASITRNEGVSNKGATEDARTAHAILMGEQKWLRYGAAFFPGSELEGEPTFASYNLAEDPAEVVDLCTSGDCMELSEHFQQLLQRYPPGRVAEREKLSAQELSVLRALGYTE